MKTQDELIRQLSHAEFHRLSDMSNDLQNAVLECHGRARAAGWWHNLQTGEALDAKALVPEKLMLIVSEVAEAMEGHRKGLMDDKLEWLPMLDVELADAVIRIFDLAGSLGINLGKAVTLKMAFNAIREDHKLEARLAEGGKKY